MSNISQVKKESNWGDASTTINSNFQNLNTDLEKVKSSTTKFKGYFTTEEALKDKFPSPKSGDTAWVGEPYPGKVYDVQSGQWHNTNANPDTVSIELNDYVNKTEFEENKQQQDEKFTELENNVGLYNVDKNVPLGSGFYTSTTARAAVPSTVRKLGLIITYKTDAATSVTEQFTGSDISAWSTEANWSKIGGNKTTNISDDINKIQLAEILDKTTNEGYRISSTGTETKDSAYNHVSFNALPTDVIIFRGSKTANVYTDFFVIEKTDGTFESLKVNSQYNNPISVIEVSLSSYSDIKKVHYNDYASNPIEIYKISDGLAYYTLSQKLKDTFANRTNYYQSIVNVLNPEDSEARKDGYYDYSNKFSSNASYQAITIPASFGNTYFAVRGDNGKLLSIGSNSYPILYLDSNKEIVQVKKIGTVDRIFVDDVRCKFLRFSLSGVQNTVKLGVIRNSNKYVEYGEASEPNVLRDFGEKSANIFDWNTMLEGKSIRMSGYEQALTKGMVKIPVQRGKTYAIGIYPDFNMFLNGESNFQEDAIGVLTTDNKTLGTIVRFRDLRFNAACTNFIYEVETSYLLNGQTYEGDIFLCFNTNAEGGTANIKVTGIVVQEGENVTTSYAKNFFKSNELKSIYSVSHLHLGDSNSFGFGVPDNTKCVNRYLGSAFMDMQYGVVNKGVSASPIGTAYNQVVALGERLKYFKIISVMHGTNCYMAENAKEGATIPKESYADIPYQTEEGVQISTIEDHCARFGSDTYSTYCKFIEYCSYYNQTALLTFISIPAFAKDEGLEKTRKTTNAVIKEICETYAIPFIDAANNAGISTRNMNKYSTDGTHLNTEEANYKWWGYVSKQLRVLSMDIFGEEIIKSIKENY